MILIEKLKNETYLDSILKISSEGLQNFTNASDIWSWLL